MVWNNVSTFLLCCFSILTQFRISFTAEFTARAEANKVALDHLRKVVTKHLVKNGRRWVSMESLFSFMKV